MKYINITISIHNQYITFAVQLKHMYSGRRRPGGSVDPSVSVQPVIATITPLLVLVRSLTRQS
jgi:hypothetical protein